MLLAPRVPPSSSTTTSKRPWRSRPTACTSAATTRAGNARAPRASCSASPHPASPRRAPPWSRARTPSARAPSGRRRRRPTPTARSAPTGSPRSALPLTCRSSRSAGSTPRTRRTASPPARKVSPSSVPRPTPVLFAQPSMQRLADVGELGLLAELERRGLVHGIENDTAEVAGAVVTQDALVEGVHFRLDWITWRDLGFRAAAVNLSDLAAAGATPDALVVTLGVTGVARLEDVVE